MCVRSPLPRVLDHGCLWTVVRIGLPEGTATHPQSLDCGFGWARFRSCCPYEPLTASFNAQGCTS